MFRSSGYHLVTLDHNLCAVWTQKGDQGHHCQGGECGSAPELSKVAGTFPIEFWDLKGRGGLKQGTVALLMAE